MKNLLLISGGGGTEHEVSIRSASYLKSKIDQNQFNILEVEITKERQWMYKGQTCSLNMQKELNFGSTPHTNSVKIDIALSAIHGFPSESGQLPALFELMDLPFFGCGQEASLLCFNKMSTKLWLENAGIKTTPFYCLASLDDLPTAKKFFRDQNNDVFVKATNQGSSVGCYRCKNDNEFEIAIKEAFTLSPFVVVEKNIKGREFELSCFEYKGETHFTHPCEILAPSENFYTYEQKYSEQSQTKVELVANISDAVVLEMQAQAKLAFKVLKIRHLSRMDFFLSPEGHVYLNEINTMPGHTSISMFPAMMESYGVNYSDFIQEHLLALSL